MCQLVESDLAVENLCRELIQGRVSRDSSVLHECQCLIHRATRLLRDHALSLSYPILLHRTVAVHSGEDAHRVRAQTTHLRSWPPQHHQLARLIGSHTLFIALPLAA